MDHCTSSTVSGSPSDHFRPSFRVMVYTRPSSLTVYVSARSGFTSVRVLSARNRARYIRLVAMIRLYQGVGMRSSVVEPSPVVTASFRVSAPAAGASAVPVPPAVSPAFSVWAGAWVPDPASVLPDPHPAMVAAVRVVASSNANIFFISLPPLF